jgi:hypothetical protein
MLMSGVSKCLLQRPVTIRDLEDVDDQIARSMNLIMTHNPDASGLTFTMPLSHVGPYEEILFKPGRDE